jgi:peptidoglycan/LPS O-acetylase OafA/YrhL
MPDSPEAGGPSASRPEVAQASREAASPAPPASRAPGHASRLAWLDALRGIAVCGVVLQHLSSFLLTALHQVVYPWLDFGQYGVMVFFLVSGYIVPASLERRGSVRTFWVSRCFRLYPMFVLAVAVATVFAVIRLVPPAGGLVAGHPLSAAGVLAHALMLQELLGIASAINVLWTLSYEMVFYLLLTLLFVAGWHRRSAGIGCGLAAAAVAFGGLLPTAALTRVLGAGHVTGYAAVLIVGGMAGVLSGHRVARPAGAVIAAGAVTVLAAVNSWAPSWRALPILAFMFTGTVLYRAQHGQMSWSRARLAVATVLVLTLAAGEWHASSWTTQPAALRELRWQWAGTIILPMATFAVAMALRNRRLPRLLCWTGVVSYSVYLVHPLLIAALLALPWMQAPHSRAVLLCVAAVFCAVLLGCCWLTYRFVEAPAQGLGRRLARWLDASLGPDAPPEGRQAQPAAVS